MAKRPKFSEEETLEMYRVTIANAEEQSAIAAALAAHGFDSKEMAKIKALLEEARQAQKANQIEDDETSAAYADFSEKRETLEDIYSRDRKKAKVIFRQDAVTLEQLGLTGRIPYTYVSWRSKVKDFYPKASASDAIKAKLARLKITEEHLTDVIEKITALDVARQVYLREKGESQDATKAKDRAMKKIDEQMSDFYVVARIALEERPQLLEALGKFVRS